MKVFYGALAFGCLIWTAAAATDGQATYALAFGMATVVLLWRMERS